MITWSRARLLSGAVLGLPVAVHAQSVRAADSVLQSGSLTRAESMYYAAARARPHDPIARWALGRYLVARGATRVGATLFEESLRFGGEPSIVGRDLAAVYVTLGEFDSLAALASATPTERMRARWLVTHQSRSVAPESVLIAVFRPSNDDAIVGHIPIRVGGRTVNAAVTSQRHGIIISDTGIIRRLHVFGPRNPVSRSDRVAVADSIGIASLSLINFPVTVAHLGNNEAAAIGLDILGKFLPTFDPSTNQLTLHLHGHRPAPLSGDHFATVTTASDLRIEWAGRWVSVTRPHVAKLLREHRWTLDSRRGQLFIEP